MHGLRERSEAFLRQLEIVFFIAVGLLGLAPAGHAYFYGPGSMLAELEPPPAVELPWLYALLLGSAIGLAGCWAYLYLKQYYYAHVAWVLEEVGSSLSEPVPVYVRVPLLWRLKLKEHKNDAPPYALQLTEWRYVQACVAMGRQPSPRALDLCGSVLSSLGGLLLIPLVVLHERASSTSREPFWLLDWAVPLAPYTQLLLFGLAVTGITGFAVYAARRYGRYTALLDNSAAMEYAKAQTLCPAETRYREF